MSVLAEASARVALTAFERIADRWGLDASERSALLGRSTRTGHRYRAAGAARISADVRQRISLLIGIFEDLRSIFGQGPLADGWIRRPNRHVGGEAPVERLRSGRVTDLVLLRQYRATARMGLTTSR